MSENKSSDNIKRLQSTEHRVSKNLFLISSVVTVVVMALFLVQFFTRGAFPPQEIGFFYLGVVLLYALHKEMLRWMSEEDKSVRRGELFVYGWIGLTIALYVVNFFTKDYFSYSAEGERVEVLKEVGSITLQVFAIFLITRGLKLFNVLSRRKSKLRRRLRPVRNNGA